MTTTNTEGLKPCPFCGSEAEFERMGDYRQSCQVRCTNCGAFHESGDEGDLSGTSWNERVMPKPDATAIRTLPDSRPLHATERAADEPEGAKARYCFRVGWNAYRNALSTTPAEPVQTPDVAFDDPSVQMVYQMLCDMEPIPDGEHWEGVVARRIVAALKPNSDCAITPSAQEAQSAITVPEGWQLVPIMPTDEMLYAVGYYSIGDGGGCCPAPIIQNYEIQDIWHLMRMAAPTQSMKDE